MSPQCPSVRGLRFVHYAVSINWASFVVFCHSRNQHFAGHCAIAVFSEATTLNTLERTAVNMDDGQKIANVDNATTGAGSSQLQVFPLERAECGERGGEFFFSLLFGNNCN